MTYIAEAYNPFRPKIDTNMANTCVPPTATVNFQLGTFFQKFVVRRVEKMTKWGQLEIWRYMIVCKTGGVTKK